MSIDRELTDHRDSEFQRLLVQQIEAYERGEEIDRQRLRREHPRHAESICQFLDNRQLLQEAFVDFRTDEHESRQNMEATIDSGRPLNRHPSSGWSFASLTKAEFPVAFGEYSLLSEIDRGGMGIVFKAKHESLNRIVALKIMRTAEMASDEELSRFRAEAESSAAINHPNIISIFEVGEFHGLIYFTMTYVEGDDLSVLIGRQNVAPKEAARIVARVANAVAAAHRCGIIHRDLKPSNILLDRRREPFLIDFGLAKTSRSNKALTCTGQILGTPAYMAPEQARGDVLSPSGDIYSLGAVLYELVAGQPPFSGPTPIDILLQVLNRDPPAPRKVNKQIPRELEWIISRAMEKNPLDRYSSAEQMQSDLERFILDEPIEHPRPTLWETAVTWWRCEPVLVSHLFAIGAVLVIVLVTLLTHSFDSSHVPLKIALLACWVMASIVLQRLSVIERFQNGAHWVWAAFDVAIYTTLIYFADPPRGLLLIGYPMMIVASGLFYRMRFVIFVTLMCIAGFLSLLAFVDDEMSNRADFCVIYISGLIVLGLCLLSMIRRIRGLADYLASGQ